MRTDIAKGNALMEILKTEYGITTEEELDEAIKRLGKLDISAFCSPYEPKKIGEKRGRQKTGYVTA